MDEKRGVRFFHFDLDFVVYEENGKEHKKTISIEGPNASVSFQLESKPHEVR